MAEAAAAAAGPAAGAEAQHPAAELAVPAAAAGASSAGGFLRMRGLPFTSGEPDIRAFFAPFELAQVLVCKRNGRSNGEAFVQLSDASQTSNALALLNRRTMGTRYIELFAASEGDLRTAESLGDNRLSRQHVVRLRGLPFNASPEDVLRFLSGVEIVRGLEGIIFTWTPDGRPTGEAFVELKDEEAQREAMKRHKEKMGARYIEIFTSTKSALVQAIQHNRLILGYANRKRWLQEAGVPPSAAAGGLLPQHPQGGPSASSAAAAAAAAAPPGTHVAQMHLAAQQQRMQEATQGFAGMAIAGRPSQPGLGASLQMNPSLGQQQQQQQQHAAAGGGVYQVQHLASGGALGAGPGSAGIVGRPGDVAQMGAYAAAPGGYIHTQLPLHAVPSAQSGQLLQVSQPSSGSSLAPGSGGYATLQLPGGQQAAVAVMQTPPPPSALWVGAPGQQVLLSDGTQLSSAYGGAGVGVGVDALGRQQHHAAAGPAVQSYALATPTGAPGGYALQAVQLPPSTHIQEYLQLSGAPASAGGALGEVTAGPAELLQGQAAAAAAAAYQMQALTLQGLGQGGASGATVGLHLLQQ